MRRRRRARRILKLYYVRWRFVVNGKANELRYRYCICFTRSVVTRDIAAAIRARRSEYNAVPDKTKIKDDVTESRSLFILRQHDRLSPRSRLLSRVPSALRIRYVHYTGTTEWRMIYCFT